MFDVAFSELVVIGVVALIVIGPEKLPKVARTLGHLTGRVQRYVAGVKADINREIQFEDLQKLQQEIANSTQTVKNQLQAVENSILAPAVQQKLPQVKSKTRVRKKPLKTPTDDTV